MTLALTANLVEERLAVSTRWFGDPADEAALDGTVARLVGDVSRMLDRLEPAPVVPGGARVDPRRPAVVLPRRDIPGCSLVVQVAEWWESVGCWWSLAGDPMTERVERYGVVRRRRWSVVLDDGYQLAVDDQWRPGPAVAAWPWPGWGGATDGGC